MTDAEREDQRAVQREAVRLVTGYGVDVTIPSRAPEAAGWMACPHCGATHLCGRLPG